MRERMYVKLSFFFSSAICTIQNSMFNILMFMFIYRQQSWRNCLSLPPLPPPPLLLPPSQHLQCMQHTLFVLYCMHIEMCDLIIQLAIYNLAIANVYAIDLFDCSD